MKKTIRIAAFAAALLSLAVMSAGCRNEKQISEDLSAVVSASEQLIALEAGEIMLHESVKLDNDVEGHAVNSITELYVKYVQKDNVLDYDLGVTVTRVVGGDITSYDARHENGKFEQYLNGEEVSVDQIPEPDLFDRFRIDITAADIENIEVFTKEGLTCYAMSMMDTYADSFDYEKDGVKYDCTQVVYNYNIDAEGVLRQVLAEKTATLTDASGASQSVVEFSQAISE